MNNSTLGIKKGPSTNYNDIKIHKSISNLDYKIKKPT